MAVSSKDMNLAQQIEEVGHQLAQFPTDVDKLLPLLDRADILLSQVDQSPSQQLLDACSIVMKPLVKEPLLRHSDVDVQVSIASCVCEITRITAPEAPYDDDEMKETFQLIVSSFKDLSNMSSKSYGKRTSILDNVARVRSSVVMLDLECDSLIVEMFHNFLGSIRDYHPENIFTWMESIMTLVIEESEDVSLELLMPILAALKKDNKDTQTISRKLGEKVLEKCAVTVKPYLLQAVKSLGGPMSQYSAVVACICEEPGVVEHHDENGSIDQLEKADKASLDACALVTPINDPSALLDVDVTKDSKAEVETNAAHQEKSEKDSQKSNNDRDNDGKDTLVVEESDVNTSGEAPLNEPNTLLDVDVTKGSKSRVEVEATHEKKIEKESQKSNDAQDNNGKDTLVVEDSNVNKLASLENEEVARVSSPKQSENQVGDVDSEIHYIHPDKSLSTKEKHTEGALIVDTVSVEVGDASGDLEGKQPRDSVPKVKLTFKQYEQNLTQEDESTKKKVVEEHTSRNPVSTDLCDSEVKTQMSSTQKSSRKKKMPSAQDAPSDLDSLKAADRAFNLSVKRQKRSGRKQVNLAQEEPKQEKLAEENIKADPKQEKLAEENVLAGKSSGKSTTSDIPIDDKSEETTSDSETKPLIWSSKEIAKRLSCKKGKKGMTSNQPKAENAKQEKGKANVASHQSGDNKKGNGLIDTKATQIKHSVKEGKKESAGSELEEELIKYVKKGKKGNDAGTCKGKKENIDEKADKGSVTGKKRNAESDSDAELLKLSAKKRQKDDKKTDPAKQSPKDEKNGTAANTNSGKGNKRNAENEPDAEVKKSGKKGRKGTAASEQEVEPEKQSGKKEKGSVARHQQQEIVKQSTKKKDTNREIISSPKSPKLASKPVKDEKCSEDSKMKSNRKQISGKNKLDIEYGANLVDSKVKVWWQDDREFYEGVIASFDPDNKRHKVLYDDGEVEILDLKKETWEFVKDGTIQNEQGDKESNEDGSAKISGSKSVKSKGGGGKSPLGDDESIMPKSNSKSNQKSASKSKSKSKTPQVGRKSDGKSKKRS